ncbi:hypothetical protein H0G86_004653 [Trichoderma simmonsii]|uniref:Uncharacterized protein n=1 Tax=Trichoderma simmonsii TaxID=1491479 RepID=A0A8G0LA25_9HYPO|nr:hypothetical protein H0G86_004653 [Trichoderma simmonsii]
MYVQVTIFASPSRSSRLRATKCVIMKLSSPVHVNRYSKMPNFYKIVSSLVAPGTTIRRLHISPINQSNLLESVPPSHFIYIPVDSLKQLSLCLLIFLPISPSSD